jgi:hypothetical protein
VNPTTSVTEALTPPRLMFDDRGHAIPRTEAEHKVIAEAFQHALEEMAAIPDDPPESDEESWRAIDEGRPERPLFKELYQSRPSDRAGERGEVLKEDLR